LKREIVRIVTEMHRVVLRSSLSILLLLGGGTPISRFHNTMTE
jgi:hypothetical protein